ncbi:hypothetical protein A2Y85_05150 [candidate division WOR-3 bacterium RBG_13_43_14]|uniref:Uncharacterized protein n=1 Tax=candidate division WOR-3 bacterium RBG_13_43_14 TaxID=1802590 RepID=A0A1F4U8G3_UNCW3|nr:MAG: hypothetical protein A2Y85_05150 [candidate division WOR-3 bacterium RBG_13_43_14]
MFSLGIGAEKIVRKVSLRAPYDSAEICIYIPGNTSLIDARPSFVWRLYPEANWYELRLKMKTETVVKVITVDTSTIYPGNKEDLLPGTYMAKILAFHKLQSIFKF